MHAKEKQYALHEEESNFTSFFIFVCVVGIKLIKIYHFLISVSSITKLYCFGEVLNLF